MAGETFEQLTSDTFHDYTQNRNCIIIFHKHNCPHCKIMFTVLEKVIAKQPLDVAAVDSEAEPALMASLGIERVPTLCAVRAGKVCGSKARHPRAEWLRCRARRSTDPRRRARLPRAADALLR